MKANLRLMIWFRGLVEVEWPRIFDFVIVRSSGAPVFFLANAIDDADMGITHVLRGEDLLDSTHRVIAIRDALGLSSPQYGHLPLLVGEDRAKLSKRHGAVALEDFKEQGYLPEALVNYLALLGWAPEDGEEIMTTAELIDRFEVDRITSSAAFFDYKKLDWVNGEYIRQLSVDELTEKLAPAATDRFGKGFSEEIFREGVALAQERAVRLNQILDQTEFLFTNDQDLVFEEGSVAKVRKLPNPIEVLDEVANYLSDCEWTSEALDLRPLMEKMELKPRKAFPAVFVATQGSTVGLPLFDALKLLGREAALTRIRRFKDFLTEQSD